MILLYVVTCFTDFILDVHTHVTVGYVFLFVMIGNMGVHLFLLVRSSIKDCIKKYKTRKLYRDIKKARLQSPNIKSLEKESE